MRKDLIRASASMRSAEQGLGKTAAAPAADDQSAALDVLAKSRDEFTRSIERLLVELRAELQTRLIADLTEMHELQSAIRETTQAQAPRVLQKSRTALITVAGLSKNEAELGERTEHLLALVEETEYGIALPTTLRILSREMRSIEGWLKAGDVAPRTVALETRVEEDLLALVQSVRRLPPTTPPTPGTPLSAGREGTRARAEPPGRRAQDGPDDPVTAQRRHGRGRQDPPRRVDFASRPPARGRDAGGHAGRDSRLAREDRRAVAVPELGPVSGVRRFSLKRWAPHHRSTSARPRWAVPTLRCTWVASAAAAGLGLVRVDQTVVVAVETVELVARAQELTAGDVAVVVAVHLLKPVRAGRGAGCSGCGHRPRRGTDHAFTGQTGEPAAGDGDLEVIRDLVGRDAAVAIAVPRHDPVDGAHHLTGAEPAVAVQVDDAEDRAALVGRRHDQARARGLDLAIGELESALSGRSCRRHRGR